jgi:hypothetical protein|tara:strand:- start:512 stop:2026 length:1515 start_codon:yes stop_codon:yes gene_type:complete
MASSDFKKFAKKYLKDFEKTAGEIKDRGKTKVTGRGKQEDQDFSIVVVDESETRAAIQSAFTTTFANVSEADQKKVMNSIMKEFKTEVRKKDISTGGGAGKLAKAWKELDPKFQDKLIAQRDKAAKHHEFAIVAGKFSGIKDWKKTSKDGIIIKAIKKGFSKLKDNDPDSDYGAPTKSELDVIGGAGKTGLQLEHGQSGGIASSTVRVIEQEKRLEGMSRSAKKKAFTKRPADARGLKKLKQAIAKYKVNMKLDIGRHQYMSAHDLKLHASYAPTLTITSAASNQAVANAEEGAFIDDFLKSLKELVDLPGSATAGEMTRDAALYNLNGNGKGRTTKGPGKPRKSQKTKSKGNAKGKFTRKETFNTMYDKGHNLSTAVLIAAVKKTKKKGRAAPRSGAAPRKSGSSKMPLHLLGILNKELPETVRANMGAPALTNQTGRFANSTRVVDMIPTAQGFPSIGYTYQRDPYEVHEQDSDYDPRSLIDQSVREIAAQHAMGRFYTRRV